MTVLDSPVAPDPNQVSYRDLAIRWGLIMAAAGIAINLIAYVSGLDPQMPDSPVWSKILFGVVGLTITVYCARQLILQDRERLGGYIGLGRCVASNTVAGGISGVVSGLFTALYVTVINPNYFDSMKEQLYSQWEEQGLGEEQMEMAWNMSSNFFGPVPMFFMALIGGLIFGAIIGLIMGAILKRERPYA